MVYKSILKLHMPLQSCCCAKIFAQKGRIGLARWHVSLRGQVKFQNDFYRPSFLSQKCSFQELGIQSYRMSSMGFVMKGTCLAKYWLGEIPTTPICLVGPGISNSIRTCKNAKQKCNNFWEG